MLDRPGQIKPPYAVPSMDEIRAIEWNGLTVCSTFAGAGGSSTGYRMAGFRVLWVNEFIEAARETYAANAAPHTIIDGRDIREVQPEDILEAIGLAPGELDILDGSPPCMSFSTAGNRHKDWGKAKAYHDKVQVNDDLFFDFVRLVDGLRPKVFVAENVSSLIKGVAKGYFLEILARLKGCGYNVKVKMLDAQWLGVPQARQRVIFIGVRDDLGVEPAHPAPLGYRYSVRDALPWIKEVSCLLSGKKPGMQLASKPCPTVMTSDVGGTACKIEAETDISRYAIGKEVEMIAGNDAYKPIWASIDKGPSPTIMVGGPHGGSGKIRLKGATEKRKFTIAELRRICGFPDDFILTGTYAQQWERLGNAVPPVMMAAIAATVRDKVLA